jgi:hypothetical protein
MEPHKLAHELFDPGRYCSECSAGRARPETWGRQLAGHPVSLNFTVADGTYESPPRVEAPYPASEGVRRMLTASVVARASVMTTPP